MEKMTYFQASDHCESLTVAGNSDWRLPSREELCTIRCFANLDCFWSSDQFEYNDVEAFYVSLTNGHWSYSNKAWAYHVLPVRAGNYSHHGHLLIGDYDVRFTDNLDGSVTDNKTGLIWFTGLNKLVLE